MPTTPNYGWDTPADTDYVTNGALSIRTLGNDADATVYAVNEYVNDVNAALDANKLNKSGGSMTGTLFVKDTALAGRAIGVQANSTNIAIIQLLNQDASGVTGFLIADTSLLVRVGSGVNELQIKSTGDLDKISGGETRPMPFATQVGYETSIPANSDVTVTLDSGRFTQAPIILLTPNVNSTTASTTFHSGNVSTSSFKIYNTSSGSRNIFWQAIQMVSNSAAG
jgi:hypothetical protein